MRFGLFGVNMGACADRGAATEIAQLAESLGYDSLWAGEHVVAPSPRVAPSPIEPDYPMLDPLVALALLAARTERVRLATGIVILPQRNPLVLAKQVASVDVVSDGRFVLGVGAGYLGPEMSAIGVPMSERGARTDEYLGAMRSLWQDDAPSFTGRHVDFDRVDAQPRPLQRPLPVVIGGHSRAAHRRAVRRAEGWFGWNLDREAAASQLDSLRREAKAAGRAFDDLEITVGAGERLDPEVVRDYERLGVDRLVLLPRQDASPAQLEKFVRANAPDLLS
jgi:probable F420-dependent oxidoreductase